MRKRFSMLSLVVVAFLVCALVVACSPQPAPSPEPPQGTPETEPPGTIKIGLALPYSGPIAHIAVPIGNLCEMTWKQINDAGGLTLDGKKYLLEWAQEDTKYSAAETVSAVQKLLDQEEIQYMVGPIPSAGTIAVMPILEQAKVPYFYISGTTQPMEAVTKGEATVPFAGTLHLSIFIPSYMKWLKDNYPQETSSIAFIEPDDETGKSTYSLASNAYKIFGIQEALEPTYVPRGTTDFAPYLSKVLKANPQSIHMLNFGGMPIALVVKQAREMGFDGLIVSGVPYVTDEFVETAGGWDNCENIITTTMPPQDDPNIPPSLLKRIKDYEAEFGEFTATMGRYVSVPDIIPGALKAADSTDPTKVIAVLESGVSLDSAFPPLKALSVSKYSHMVAGSNFITIVEDGKIKFLTIFTPDQALEAATIFYEELDKNQ